MSSASAHPTVVVTGPARGLGLAISQTLVAEGYFVLGVGRQSSRAFQLLGQESSFFFPFDLSNVEEIRILSRKIISHVGGAPYGLVNNAGIGLDSILGTQHEADISKMLRVNLHAPILLTKYLARQMVRARRGRVISVSSIIASTGFNGLAVYAATKAGLQGFTKSLSREVGRSGVTVNCVAPGFMETDMTAALALGKLESIVRRAPLGLPQTTDVAAAVSYLLSPAGERISGATITVDGGSTA